MRRMRWAVAVVAMFALGCDGDDGPAGGADTTGGGDVSGDTGGGDVGAGDVGGGDVGQGDIGDDTGDDTGGGDDTAGDAGGGDEALCVSTGGTWVTADATCTCDAGATWKDGVGCEADQTLEECLLACGDGCFSPAQMVCGADGQFGCPCEMACHGIAVAEDPMSCCEPVPSNCVPTCQDNVAMNCTSTIDDYGCYELQWTTDECDADSCVVSYEDDLASCVAGAEALCVDTAGGWSDGVCNCGMGGAFDLTIGCHSPDKAPCEATGGTWVPLNCGTYCGECDCPDGESFAVGKGCQSDDLAACLLACGDGCFGPDQEVCGDDGEWGCPCEMACHGIAVAAEPLSCCEPVPPGCVATCFDGFATSCTTTLDGHGCLEQAFSTVGCGGMACLAATPSGVARCVDPCAPMDAALGTGMCDTAWGWKWSGSECAYLGGTCTCDGDDCNTLYESESACLAVHGVCLTTPDPATVCAATAGSFSGGSCDCDEGGAFAPAYGCYPASANACLATGGQWLPAFFCPYCGDCQCPGVSTFDPAQGCIGG